MKLVIENLSKWYGKKEVLKDIDYSFDQGKIYGLLGRNGAGKTTFFNAIDDDIEVDSGKFYLEDEFGKNKLNIKDIGYVTSTPVVPEFLTAEEFLKFYIDINYDSIDNPLTLDEYFNIVKINKKDRNLLLRDFSHGMKNKIQILVYLISQPKIILLDEPLTSLDIVVQEDMKNLLKKIKKDHIIILSTHILDLATDLCDEVVLLSDKKLEHIKRNNLNTKEYRKHIIEELRNDGDD